MNLRFWKVRETKFNVISCWQWFKGVRESFMDHSDCLYFFPTFKPHFPRTAELKPNNLGALVSDYM